jgi:hypothetical protein
VVRVPSWDWPNAAPPEDDEIPYLTSGRPAVVRLGPQEWDVTEPFVWQHVPGSRPFGPDGSSAPAGYGLLLTGGPSIHDLTAQDDTICVSQLTNIGLLVTYTVPEGGEGPVVR